jgi:hypothetical protein
MRAVELESASVIAVQKSINSKGQILIKTTNVGGVRLARGKQPLQLTVQWLIKSSGGGDARVGKAVTLGLKDGVKIVAQAADSEKEVTPSRCMHVCVSVRVSVCECVAVASVDTRTDTHALSEGARLYASATSIDLPRQGGDAGQ